MKHGKLLKEVSRIIEPYCITKGEKFRLKDHDPADTNGLKDKHQAQGLLEDGIALLATAKSDNVVLLADLFHMNIEEVDIAAALRAGGKHIGHLHFVDSNRRPAGCGHLDFAPIAAALKEIGYNGYASAEAFPYPDSDQAAKLTIDAYRRFFGK